MSEYYEWYDEAHEYRIYIYIMKNDHTINNHNFHFFYIQNISLMKRNISDYSESSLFGSWWVDENKIIIPYFFSL